MRRALALLMLLAACGREPPAAPAVFRNTATPIWSNAVFDAGQLSGDWRQVASFGAACAPGSARFQGGQMQATLCLNGERRSFSGPFAVTGPGRILPAGASEEWWILWVDVGTRTMAIGTRSGSLGFVLDREGATPPDRMQAAREILDWNGFDLTRMVVY